MDESVEKHAILYLPPDGDHGILDALKTDGWHMAHKDDQLESAFSFLLIVRQYLLEKSVPHPTRLALIMPSSPEPPPGLLDLLNGPLQSCGLLQWNGATLIERRPGELLQPPVDPRWKIHGDPIKFPPTPTREEIDELIGPNKPGKPHRPKKPRRFKKVSLALTRDARRRAEAEGIAMARGTECFDAANTFDAIWAIKAAQTQRRQIALLMLGEELGEEGHRLSKAADILEPELDIHWLGKEPVDPRQSTGRLPDVPPEVEIEIPTPKAPNESVPSGEVTEVKDDHQSSESVEGPVHPEGNSDQKASLSGSRGSNLQGSGPPPPPPSEPGTEGREPPQDPTDLDLLRAAAESPEALLPIALQAIAAATGGSLPKFHSNAGEIRVGLPGGPELGWLSGLPSTASTPAEAWGEWLAHWLDHAQRFAEAKRDAITDALTLTLNRRGFEQHLREVIHEGTSQRHPFSILKLDVDDFKQWNDRYGDEAGDGVLKAFAEAIRNAIRPADQIARVGGDEFVVILADFTRRTGPESHVPRGFSVEATQDLLDRIRDGVARVQLEVPGRIRFSGGLATWPWDILDQCDQDPINGLVQLADRRLKISKRDGKNRIEFGGQPPA